MAGEMPDFWDSVFAAQKEGAIMGYLCWLHMDEHAEPECEQCRYFLDVIQPEAYRRLEAQKEETNG